MLRLAGGSSGLWLLRNQCRALSGAAAAVRAGWSSYDTPDVDYTEAITDLGNPAAFYPVARRLERHIIAHLGPTNSGKTHEALQHLRRSESGVYCGPLRLLAWQVLDEIQMLGDESRGWAFTRALLGLPARTLHVCGDPAALPLLERVMAETGDRLEVRRYERLSPLQAARRPLADLSQVQRGDCVVSFSRREVHAVRQEIQSHGRERACVIYGALPPDARQLQASLFNTPRTGYNVLSASDAVGMGLNLAIRRVIFTTLRKFDGTQERQLTTAEIKQVAGRAGRYGSRFPTGVVTAMNPEDSDILADALQQPSDELQTAFVFPSLAQLEMLHSQHPKEKLPGILRLFAAAAQGSLTHTHYSYAKHEEVASALLGFATAYAARRRVTPASILLPPMVEARSEMELQQLEASHRVLDLWLWLSHRFPDAWAGAEEVAERRAQLAQLIDASIRSMGMPREPRRQVAAAEAPTQEEIAALAAALEHQRQEEEWQQRRSSYRKRRR
ncbi:hypothetical protein COHA_010398 [Chlorella ohadii]|uniref:Helicase C-terminal domain-containing protein n=1 Tax=Chlorella ohadii TaxID=2649997 RepID=A0AAD5DCX3_9CHLO|nr:hypothetical protein COHA_010398 [Chlorella ohadii]